jgi:hypothetical protein
MESKKPISPAGQEVQGRQNLPVVIPANILSCHSRGKSKAKHGDGEISARTTSQRISEPSALARRNALMDAGA